MAGAEATSTVVKGTMQLTGKAAGTYVTSGGVLKLIKKAKATGTVISAGGQETVNKYATDSNAKVAGALDVSGKTSGATVQDGGVLTLKKGAVVNKATVAGGGTLNLTAAGKLTGTTTLKQGAEMLVAGAGLTGKAIKANADASVVFDVRSIKKSAPVMLTADKQRSLGGAVSIVTKKAQRFGTYKLAEKYSFQQKDIAIKLGSKALTSVTLGGPAKKKDGMAYSVAEKGGVTTLNVSIVTGGIFKGTAKDNQLAGTNNCDAFFGGKGDDTIKGVNGRDVAIYNATNWGKDTIAKTSGTMTVLMVGVKESQVKKSLSKKGVMTITRLGKGGKALAGQKISVAGWNAETHNILYRTETQVAAFTKYLKAANPTETQTQKAAASVFKQAGLASA
jgi:autotransporter passenger strand-loop-strand repeat protein